MSHVNFIKPVTQKNIFNTNTMYGKDFKKKYDAHKFFVLLEDDEYTKDSIIIFTSSKYVLDGILLNDAQSVYISEVTLNDDAIIISSMEQEKFITFFKHVVMSERKMIWSYPIFCKKIVSKCGLALIFIPNEFRTKEILKLAVKTTPDALGLIEYQTEKLCKSAVKRNGLALFHVVYKTKKICKIALRQNGMAIKYVPNDILNEKLCLIAIADPIHNTLVFEHIRENMQTEELCMMAFTKVKNITRNKTLNKLMSGLFGNKNVNLAGFKFVLNKSYNLCKIVLAADGCLIKYVNLNLYKIEEAIELCYVAISQNPNALEFIAEEYQTRQICELAIKKNTICIMHVKKQTMSLCRLAISLNKDLIQYVDEDNKKLFL